MMTLFSLFGNVNNFFWFLELFTLDCKCGMPCDGTLHFYSIMNESIGYRMLLVSSHFEVLYDDIIFLEGITVSYKC